MPELKQKGPLLLCPRSGRIVGVRIASSAQRIFLVLVGPLALAWYLTRVVPKPSRSAYPCQQIVGPIAFSFLAYVTTSLAALVTFRKAGALLQRSRYILASVCFLLALLLGMVNLHFSVGGASAAYLPLDLNQPIGVAQGIHPGRVVWVHEPEATSLDSTGGEWWSDANTDQDTVDRIVSLAIRALTQQLTDAAAWDALFRFYNRKAEKGDIGYQAGEQIAMKINLNNQNLSSGNRIDASPQMVRSLLRQLVHHAGVPQESILVYDAKRPLSDAVYNACSPEFASVQYKKLPSTIQWANDAITYSAKITDSVARRIPQFILDSDYLINLAILKRHNAIAAVTLCGKNHYGTIGDPWALHDATKQSRWNMGSYDPQVDLMGCGFLGAKTLLYLIDGLYGAFYYNAEPTKWQSAPFNDDWPSSLFVSQDPVAIDSVGLDFLRTEWMVNGYADNYLHEAALANDPPSGTFYDPENDGSRMASLGVHEHWNNAIDKQYSRNLGTGQGIEIIACYPGADVDADQMPDIWEIDSFGSTTHSAGQSHEDWDQDGMSDREEYVASTGPTDPESFFTAQTSWRSSEEFLIEWESAANRLYSVESSTSLNSAQWSHLFSNIPPSLPVNVVTVDMDSVDGTYFRVRITERP